MGGRVRRFGFGVAALLACACSSGEPAPDASLDQRIPAAPGGLLRVGVDLGDEAREDRVSLEVRAHDADEVWAVADVSGPGASSVAFRLEHDPEQVRLYARSRGIQAWLFGGPSVQLRVFVPRRFALDLRSVSGPIWIEEVSGEIRARTRDARLEVRSVDGPLRLRSSTGVVAVSEVAGDVEVRGQDAPIELAWVHGKVDARTGSGNIEARHLDGELQLRADKGELQLRDVHGPVHAKTESGAIYASFVGEPSGELETQRGSIEVSLPEQAHARIEAQAGHGEVQLGKGIAPDGVREPGRAVGLLNGGGETLRVYTAHGSLRVDAR
jgi:hypothetical protein